MLPESWSQNQASAVNLLPEILQVGTEDLVFISYERELRLPLYPTSLTTTEPSLPREDLQNDGVKPKCNSHCAGAGP